MSHFTVMVIGENPQEQLAPFDEDLKVEFVNESEKYKTEYETKKVREFYCDSNSNWGVKIHKKLFDLLEQSDTGSIHRYEVVRKSLQYYHLNGKYKGYCLNDDGTKSDDNVWFGVDEIIKTTHPDDQVCFEGTIMIRKIDPPKELLLKEKYPVYDDYLKHWHGIENPKYQGYWTNPNAKWDWYLLGGRWSGLIKLRPGARGKVGTAGVFENETGIDQAKKKDIANLAEIRTFAIVKDGQWYERGSMGWWGCVSKEKPEDQWESEFKTLVDSLPDETLISIFDCHI